MKAKLLALVMTMALVGSSAICVHAATADTHTHNFKAERYVRTEQDGSYVHYYVWGYDANGNEIRRACTVLCEIEYWIKCCTVSGCYLTYGEEYPKEYVESHTNCPQ